MANDYIASHDPLIERAERAVEDARRLCEQARRNTAIGEMNASLFRLLSSKPWSLEDWWRRTEPRVE